MATPKRPQINKMGSNGPARKAPMSRTAGTAKRLLGRSESIGFKLKAGMPLTGSASGVKSITTREAGEALTQGIVSLNKKNKLQMDPTGLAMALPLGKVLKARNALALGGKITQAVALDERLAAKAAGKAFGRSLAERKAAGGGPIFETIKNSGFVRRAGSNQVFPRAASGAAKTPSLREEYKTVKQGYEQVFGKGKKVSSFNPDIAAMTMRPGSGGSAAKIRKISNQVDAYLKKRGGKTIGK